MKFLVVGGAGYVGSHFVAAAMRAGHECHVLDNLSTGHKEAIDGCTSFVKTDIRRQVGLADYFDRVNPDAVLHFAANALVAESVADPKKYYDNNVLGTKSLLEVMARNKSTTPLVFSSTCAVYGEPRQLPIDESSSREPLSPYGRSKLACEFMIEDFCRAYGLRGMAVRYFNAAGADNVANIGERHDPETHLIPLVLAAAKAGTKIEIFGSDYPTPDGTCVRDYIHVIDLAEYHLRAAVYLSQVQSGTFTAVNLGSGVGYSNLAVIEMAKKVTKSPVDIVSAPRRPGDPPSLWASISKVEGLLGYSPRHSSLEEIMRTAWAWQQQPRF